MPTVKMAGDANTMTEAMTSAHRAPGPWAMTPPRAFPAAAAVPSIIFGLFGFVCTTIVVLAAVTNRPEPSNIAATDRLRAWTSW